MAASNINRVTITGNLTRDPELRALQGGNSVCSMRVAVNTRRKNGASGEWEDRPNYFDVTVWGAQGENCSNYLKKGRPVAIDGRLQWREWQDQSGNKRQSVDIVADTVQFLGSRDEASYGGGGSPSNGGGGDSDSGGGFASGSDVPADTSDFGDTASVGADDDIPF